MQIHMQQDGIRQNRLFTVIVALLLSISLLSILVPFTTCRAGPPPTLYVGKGEAYTRIQDALDNVSSDGYRIFVYNGTYMENLTINYSIDLFGEDRAITIIDGNGTDTVITINADHVNISHFTITNSGASQSDSIIQVDAGESIITDNIISNGYNGIFLQSSNGHLIYDNVIINNTGNAIQLIHSNNNLNISFNTVTANGNGIYAYESDGNKIYNNLIHSNTANGIFLNKSCTDNYISNNNCSFNNHSGIYVNDYSDYSTILDNQIYRNNDSGVKAENCSRCMISNENIIRKNTNYGVMIIGSNNAMQDNIILNNFKDGLYCSADNNNTVSSNTIGYNLLAGIRLYNSSNDYIYNNEIFSNYQHGVYLDFFAVKNYIYNNYFHENVINAIDKSLGRNIWNTTKHSGTNIVGGPFICGNYWDTYDEVAEGAIDGNGDGIADSSFTVYTTNKDNGALLDVVKPTLGAPQVSPQTQSLGGYTNISVVITDNTKVHEVYLTIISPKGQISNFSIFQNKTGDTYYCRKQFSPVGNYSFFVNAKDPRNWEKTANYTFSIRPGAPPVIKDNSPTQGSPSGFFTFNVTVTSKNASASDLHVYVNWSHDEFHRNQTIANHTNNYFMTTITLNHSIADLTYYFYAIDQWGNAAISPEKKVVITDVLPPQIQIDRYGPSFENIPNSYTFGVTVFDNSIVSNVTIQYWCVNTTKMSVSMESLGQGYYQKVIVPQGSPKNVFCVISAADIAGNTNDTRSPYAVPNGPTHGFVLQEILFNGTHSFDLDGTIVSYEWDFGDGVKGNGSAPTHIYSADGTYTVSLTVIDNEGRNGTKTTSIQIIALTRHLIPTEQLAFINSRYNIVLSEQFFSYDSDGDGQVDTFVDPNQILTLIPHGSVNISHNSCLLLSIGNTKIPVFFWNTATDTIVPITHTIGAIKDKNVNEATEQATVHVTVEKDQWIYLETSDVYPSANLTISTGGRQIPDDRIWRMNGNIYALDDPGREYLFVFDHIYPTVQGTFSPSDGGIIDQDTPTIMIRYNVPVTILIASFDSLGIEGKLTTYDDMTFFYTPPGYLKNGTYQLEIDAQALQGSGYLSSAITYLYFNYEQPPQASFFEKYWTTIVMCCFIGGTGALLVFFKVKGITIDSFIYIKNKKVIPFFKPVIVGPMSVQITDQGLSRAEFYVDGALKGETTTFPYLWQWDEKAFMKHTMETKVYDQEGNGVSSGKMEFYIFHF